MFGGGASTGGTLCRVDGRRSPHAADEFLHALDIDRRLGEDVELDVAEWVGAGVVQLEGPPIRVGLDAGDVVVKRKSFPGGTPASNATAAVMLAAFGILMVIALATQGTRGVVQGLKGTSRTFLDVWPPLLLAFGIAGFLRVVIPHDLISDALGPASGIQEYLIGWAPGRSCLARRTPCFRQRGPWNDRRWVEVLGLEKLVHHGE